MSKLDRIDGPSSARSSGSLSGVVGSETSSMVPPFVVSQSFVLARSCCAGDESRPPSEEADALRVRKEALRLSFLSDRTYEASSAVSSRTLRA